MLDERHGTFGQTVPVSHCEHGLRDLSSLFGDFESLYSPLRTDSESSRY